MTDIIIGNSAFQAIWPWFVVGIVAFVSLFWAVGVFRWRGGIPHAIEPQAWPSVTVIVAGRNEENTITECLESIAALDYPRDRIEAIFVDDHSTDKTKAIAESVALKCPDYMKILSAPDKPAEMGSKKRALAHAISQTRSDYILLTDADNRVRPGWVKELLSEFDNATGAVFGASVPLRQTSLRDRLYFLERMAANVAMASASTHRIPGSACGQNIALRRSAFESIGGFAHPTLPSGDDDLTVQAIARAGWKVKFASSPESVVSDSREIKAGSHLNAEVRHQSVAKFYPVGWQLAYAFSILSAVVLLCLFILSFVDSRLWLPFFAALSAKAVIESLAAKLAMNRLQIKLSLFDLIFAQILLPFYTVIRPTLLLLPRFSWRGLQHVTRPYHPKTAS